MNYSSIDAFKDRDWKYFVLLFRLFNKNHSRYGETQSDRLPLDTQADCLIEWEYLFYGNLHAGHEFLLFQERYHLRVCLRQFVHAADCHRLARAGFRQRHPKRRGDQNGCIEDVEKTKGEAAKHPRFAWVEWEENKVCEGKVTCSGQEHAGRIE